MAGLGTYGNHLYSAGNQVASTRKGNAGSSSDGSSSNASTSNNNVGILARRNGMYPYFRMVRREIIVAPRQLKCQ